MGHTLDASFFNTCSMEKAETEVLPRIFPKVYGVPISDIRKLLENLSLCESLRKSQK